MKAQATERQGVVAGAGGARGTAKQAALNMPGSGRHRAGRARWLHRDATACTWRRVLLRGLALRPRGAVAGSGGVSQKLLLASALLDTGIVDTTRRVMVQVDESRVSQSLHEAQGVG